MVKLDLHEDSHADGAAKKIRFKPENMILQSHQGGGSVRLRYTMADMEVSEGLSQLTVTLSSCASFLTDLCDTQRRCRTHEARIKRLQELYRGIEEDGPDKQRVRLTLAAYDRLACLLPYTCKGQLGSNLL